MAPRLTSPALPPQSQTFTTSGTWSHPAPGTPVRVDIRAWAGGGGGSTDNTYPAHGGGGAGYSQDSLLVTTDLTVTVGAGGAGGTYSARDASDGGLTKIEDSSGNVLVQARQGTGAGGNQEGFGGLGSAFNGGVGGNHAGEPQGSAPTAYASIGAGGESGGASFGMGGEGSSYNTTAAMHGVKGGGGGGLNYSQASGDNGGDGGDGGVIIIW